jgi:hypothetical protein
MAAAAFGNTISDVAGIGSAWYVENVAAKIGVRSPLLTAEQLKMRSTALASNMVRINIVLCIADSLKYFYLFHRDA